MYLKPSREIFCSTSSLSKFYHPLCSSWSKLHFNYGLHLANSAIVHNHISIIIWFDLLWENGDGIFFVKTWAGYRTEMPANFHVYILLCQNTITFWKFECALPPIFWSLSRPSHHLPSIYLPAWVCGGKKQNSHFTPPMFSKKDKFNI